MKYSQMDRKTSVEESQGSQEYNSEYLFAFTDQKPQAIWQLLQIHFLDLLNCCFRCHKPQISAICRKFKQLKHPEIVQPQISKFYQKQCFPNLVQIGKWLEKSQQQQFPNKYIPPIPKSLQFVLDEIYNEFKFIPNFQRALLFYPNYLVKHNKVRTQIFNDSLIPTTTLYWISCCAAGELGCQYMLNRAFKKFIAQGGDRQWLEKGKFPQKFKQIQILIRKVGRCPWEISQMVQKIAQDGVWSMKELLLMFQVIVYTHKMSTIALALGLNCQEDIDLLGIKQIREYKNQYDSRIYETNHHQKLGKIADFLLKQSEEKTTKRQQKKKVKRSQNEQLITGYMKQIGNQLNNQNLYRFIIKALEPLLPPFSLIQKRMQHNYPHFDYLDYNLDQHGYPLLAKLVGETADSIFELLKCSQEMTMNNFGAQQRNTKKFRKAMQYYSQNLCGYTHMGQQYAEMIKQYLTMPLKYYIRLLTLSPAHISQQVITSIQHEKGVINCLDMGHIAVLIADTKMSFCFVTFLNAINTNYCI